MMHLDLNLLKHQTQEFEDSLANSAPMDQEVKEMLYKGKTAEEIKILDTLFADKNNLNEHHKTRDEFCDEPRVQIVSNC